MRRLDGTTFWARETVRAQRTPGGEVILYEGLIEDITERRCAGQLLQASELRYRRLFEAAKDGIFILEAETAEIVDVNPFLCDLLGLSREEVLGKKLWEIGPFKDVRESKLNFAELQLKEYVRDDDLPLEKSNGVKVAVEFVSNVYPVNGGKVIQCNVRDITERKKSAQEHARLIRAVQQAAETIVITDPQRHHRLRQPGFRTTSRAGAATRSSDRTRESSRAGSRTTRSIDRCGRPWPAARCGRAASSTVARTARSSRRRPPSRPCAMPPGEIVNYVAVKRDVTDEMRLDAATVPGAEDGGGRAPCRRRRPRLQQPPRRHHGLRRRSCTGDWPATIRSGERWSRSSRRPSGRRA